MADYTEIKGNRIQYLDSDPTLTSAIEGQVWYNTATGTLKGLTQIKAWSSGGDLATPRRYLAGCGLQTSALAFGGLNPGSNLNATEEYSGFSWNTGGNLGTAVGRNAGAGTQTAGLSFGGQSTTITNQTEEYDGSSWTAGGAMNTGRSLLAGAGIQNAGLAFGGNEPALSNKTEEYDGSSWTVGGTLNTARKRLAGTGTQTSALAFGGETPANTGATEEYDGTTWTASNSLNTAGDGLGGAGTQTDGLAFAGSGRPTATEEYDGTNWTTSSATLANGRTLLGSAGTRAAGLGFGGYGVPFGSKTEEYNSNLFSPQISTWSSGTNLPGNRYDHAGTGDQNASVIWSGAISSGTVYTSTSLEYDGSTWTSGGNQLYDFIAIQAGTGTQTSALGMGGRAYPPYVPSAVATDITQEYDGSTWTAGGNLNVARWKPSAAGIQTAALCFTGGGGPGPLSTSEAYDGTSWTTTSPTNIAVGNGAGGGLQTSAIRCGGLVTTTYQSTSEEYDGSVWTSTSPINEARYDLQVGATNSDLAWNSGGYNSTPTTVTTTEEWDGTGWSTTSPMAQARANFNGTGPGDSGIATGGFSGGSIIAVEEYNRGNTTVTASTLTTS